MMPKDVMEECRRKARMEHINSKSEWVVALIIILIWLIAIYLIVRFYLAVAFLNSTSTRIYDITIKVLAKRKNRL